MLHRIVLAVGLLTSGPVLAISSDFDLLLDLDNNPATGCTVATSGGNFHGVEYILTTSVETDGLTDADATGATRRECTDPGSDTFGPPAIVEPGDWPVGIGNGIDGFNVVETTFPLPQFYQLTRSAVRIGVAAEDELGNTATLLEAEPGSGTPIILGAPDPLIVPALGVLGLGLLALGLVAVGLVVLHRHGRVTLLTLVLLSGGAAAGVGTACVLDGQIDEWNPVDLLADGPATDPDSGVDLRALFGKRAADNTHLCFRIDTALVFAAPPVATDDSYTTVETDSLNIPAGSGVLANDDRGIPPGDVTVFGGGSLGGTVTDNSAGDTVTIGADGSLTLNADGSFDFQAETGFDGPFSFEYRLENTIGDSEATVTVEVQSIPVAADDAYEVLAGETLNVPAAGVLDNDSGYPDPEVASFGGGDLGGGVGDNAAGSTITVGADGSLSINADGSLNFTPESGFNGEFTFDYRIENPAGQADAGVLVTVNEPPTITSADSFTCQVGAACDFDFTATGHPAPTLAQAGALPAGVIFDAGTEALTGTPDPGTGGEYALTITAANGINPDATQDFTLFVEEPPAITSANSLTCPTGNPCDFQFTADGYPDPSFTLTGTLPDGVTFDAGAGSLTGTPAADAGGVYALDLTAANGIAPDANQAFTLTVEQPPTITSADALTCSVGSSCAFAFTADGYPVPDFTVTGTLPAGVTFDGASDSLTGTPDPGTGGEYPLSATAANGVAPDANQAFMLTVNEVPEAIDDPAGGIPPDSSPGSMPYHGTLNTTLNVADGPGVLDNDQRGFPEAEITDLSPISNAGGSVTLNIGGGFAYTPPADFTGIDSFEYCIDNTEGNDCATVQVAVGVRPDAADDTYPETLIGNVFIDTAASTSYTVLDFTDGDQLSLVLDGTTNGDASLDTGTGTFEFDPATGFNGDATLSYTVDNGFNQPATGTITLPVAERIWFIQEGAAGDGRLSNPAGSLAAVTGPASAGDSYFLYSGNHTCGVTLGDSQFVIGQGATPDIATIAGLTVPADSSLPATGGARPQLSATDGCLEVGADNTLRGFDIGHTGTGPAVEGSSFNSLFVREIALSGGGQTLALNAGDADMGDDSLDVVLDSADSTSSDAAGMELINTTGSLAVDSAMTLGGAAGNGLRLAFGSLAFTTPGLTVTNAGNNGIDLEGNTTAIDLGGGAVIDSANHAVRLAANNTNITYDGDITHSGTGYSLDSDAHAGGDVTLGGDINDTGLGVRIANGSAGIHDLTGGTKTLNTGASPAVSLSNNTGMTINFLNGGLAVTTNGADGFIATGGGTVTVAGSGNTLATTAGRALTVTDTDIGGGSMTFESIDASGADHGIVLNNAGSGSLTVTGTGSPPAAGSGGSIANTAGDGISLTNARNISLAGMIVDTTGRHGIYGSGVSAATPGSGANAFTFRHGEINAAGDGNDENAIHFGDGPNLDNLRDAVTLDDVIFDGYAENALHIANHTVAVDVTVSNVLLRNADTTVNSNGLLLQSLTGATAQFDLSVTSSTFGQPAGGATICCTGITLNAQGNGAHSLIVQDNTFENMSRAGSGQGISVATTETGDMTLDISNNAFIDLDASHVGIAPLEDSSMTGTITGNTFTGPNIQGVAISIVGDGEEGIPGSNGTFTGIFEISGNTITGQSAGLRLMSRDTSDPNGRMDFTVFNNLVESLGSGQETVFVNSLDSATLCADISANTITTDAGSIFDDIGLAEQHTSSMNIGQASAAALSGDNNGASVAELAGTPTYGATCNTP